MIAVYKKELNAYFCNVYGFLFAAVILLVVGVMIFLTNLNPNLLNADIGIPLQYGAIAMILMVPVLCMRTMAEDRRNKTEQFYFSLPLRSSAVVLGKYLALLTVFALPTLILCVYPLILGSFGDVNYLHTYLSILMFFLLGATLMAICMFLSSLTGHAVISAALGVLVILALYLLPMLANVLPTSPLASYIGLTILVLALGGGLLGFTGQLSLSLIVTAVGEVALAVTYLLSHLNGWELFDGLLCDVLSNVSPFFLFDSMLVGQTLDLFAVFTMVALSAFFVYLTAQSAEKRRLS